jgi:cytochrome c-type biogenesis protein CcmE
VIGLVFLGLAIVFVLLPLAGSASYLATGSLEMHTTPERREGVRIVGLVGTAVFGALEALFLWAFVLEMRENDETQRNSLRAIPHRADGIRET